MNKLRSIILVALAVVMGSTSPGEAETTTTDVEGSNTRFESGAVAMDYGPGSYLLTSDWNQVWPYNKFCPKPSPPCTEQRLHGHVYAGCTAIAAAQIMRYWAWPPGRYWWDMPDTVTETSPEHQINAVAGLCGAAGAMVGPGSVAYTCNWTLILPGDMHGALTNSCNYYATLQVGVLPPFPSVADWHKMVKDSLNENRPVLYSYLADPIEDSHSVVVDGWRGAGNDLEWHINHGWPEASHNRWYPVNTLGPVGQVMIRDIRPAPSLGPTLMSGYFHPLNLPALGLTPYPYFDQDCTNAGGVNHTFGPGMTTQFLAGVKLKCVGLNNRIRFEQTNRLFSIKGTKSVKIETYNGAVVLHPGGGIRFH